MKQITIKRYYISDFMYDNYKDDPTNIYDGFFVEVMPNIRVDDYVELWLGHIDYADKFFMFGIPSGVCDTDEDTIDLIKSNVNEHIEEYVADRNFEDECDCEHCYQDEDIKIDGSLLEAIEMHNNHVEKMQDLAQTLMDNIPNVEGTPIDKAFGEAFNSLIGNAIYLCCEANSYGGCKWMTTDDWCVTRDEDLEE